MDRTCYSNDYSIPLYPDSVAILPSYFDTACFREAKDEETVKLILDHCGSGRGNTQQKKYVYPTGWSFEKYIETLTDEDKESLRNDRERLKRLHGRDIIYEE